MQRSINFVRERRKKLSQAQVQDQKWFTRSAIGLGIVIGLMLMVLGGRLVMAQLVSQVLAQQEQTRDQILSREDTEKAFVISVNKLSILSEIYEERQNKQDAIQYFTSVFGEGVLVKEIAFQGNDQLLTFRLQADDVFILDQVFVQLESEEVLSRFARVENSDLRRGDEGKYEMTVAVTLGARDAAVSGTTETTDDTDNTETTS